MPTAKTKASTQLNTALSPAPGTQPAGTLGTQVTVHGGAKDVGFCLVRIH